jgi:hypothetical protein
MGHQQNTFQEEQKVRAEMLDQLQQKLISAELANRGKEAKIDDLQEKLKKELVLSIFFHDL